MDPKGSAGQLPAKLAAKSRAPAAERAVDLWPSTLQLICRHHGPPVEALHQPAQKKIRKDDDGGERTVDKAGGSGESFAHGALGHSGLLLPDEHNPARRSCSIN